MKSSIIPTVGRIVLARVEVKRPSDGAIVRETLPATILRVFLVGDDEYCVNVKVFGDSTNTGWEFKELYSVPIIDPAGPDVKVAGREWCEWMPYQKGQAALTESIAKKAGINA